MFWAGFACGVGAFLVASIVLLLVSERIKRNSRRDDPTALVPPNAWSIADTYSTKKLSTFRASNENQPRKYGSA